MVCYIWLELCEGLSYKQGLHEFFYDGQVGNDGQCGAVLLVWYLN